MTKSLEIKIVEEKYLIEHIEGGYLYKTVTARWERTQNINKATRLSYEKAQNVIQNSIRPPMRKYWQITEVQQYISFPPQPASDIFDPFNWEEIYQAQHTLFQDLYAYREQLNTDLSNVDQEICDIQHYIEFYTLDAAKGYKAYRMLKECLLRRRNIKTEMAKADSFLSSRSKDFSSGHTEQQIHKIDHCSYTPRILRELFQNELQNGRVPHIT